MAANRDPDAGFRTLSRVWLKPRTSLNIVIRGAAGSLMVISGGAAVDAWASPAVLWLAALVFLWTPIHFWGLAMVYREDYQRADVPMLPVTTRRRIAAIWAFIHGIGMALTVAELALQPGMGPLFGLPALAVTVVLIYQATELVIRPTKHHAWRLFHTSNLHLFVVLWPRAWL